MLRSKEILDSMNDEYFAMKKSMGTPLELPSIQLDRSLESIKEHRAEIVMQDGNLVLKSQSISALIVAYKRAIELIKKKYFSQLIGTVGTYQSLRPISISEKAFASLKENRGEKSFCIQLIQSGFNAIYLPDECQLDPNLIDLFQQFAIEPIYSLSKAEENYISPMEKTYESEILDELEKMDISNIKGRKWILWHSQLFKPSFYQAEAFDTCTFSELLVKEMKNLEILLDSRAGLIYMLPNKMPESGIYLDSFLTGCSNEADKNTVLSFPSFQSHENGFDLHPYWECLHKELDTIQTPLLPWFTKATESLINEALVQFNLLKYRHKFAGILFDYDKIPISDKEKENFWRYGHTCWV